MPLPPQKKNTLSYSYKILIFQNMTLRNSDIYYELGQACWILQACSKHGSMKTRQSKLICNIITKSNGRILFTGRYPVFDK